MVTSTVRTIYPQARTSYNPQRSGCVRQTVGQFLRSRSEDDVTWQKDMTALIERMRSRVSPIIDPDEAERDMREGRQDVRAARR